MAKKWLPGVARPRLGGDTQPPLGLGWPRVNFLLSMT